MMYQEENKVIYFRGAKAKFVRMRETKAITWNRVHEKTNFRVLGNRVIIEFILGYKGTGTPTHSTPRPGTAS